MANFDETQWADSDFSQNYRDEANVYLPFRRQFIETAKSLYAHFVGANKDVRVLDLGCGDGLFVQELLKSFSPSSVTLVDGSDEMLKAAQKRLTNNSKTNFIQATFQDLITGNLLNKNFNFIFSSLAIHHLTSKEKKQLYTYIHELMSANGCFVHYDVVAPSSGKLEKLYLDLWREWIKEHPNKEMGKKLFDIPDKYKANPDNIPDTLMSQLQMLEVIGFKEVDCYFKHGIFSLFGGVK